MRVIAGTAKGKRLKIPKGAPVRPTQDKVKEAIFNMLGDRIIDAKVLDIYSGSGALGIEALSRGACRCVFVDRDVKCIRDNLEVAGFEARVIKGNVDAAIKKLAKEKEKFDVVLADPPYDKGLTRNILSYLDNSDILCSFGIVVIEHSKRERILREKVKEKQYGDTVISVVKYEKNNSNISRDI